jgi:hypothetical protein
MRRKRKSVAVSVDLDLLEAGREAVADGRAWSFSAWVNEALRRQLEYEKRPLGVVRSRSNSSRSQAGPQP